jgi:hypothetical protein
MALTDPLVLSPATTNVSSHLILETAVSPYSLSPKKKTRIEMALPTLLDVVTTNPPVLHDGLTYLPPILVHPPNPAPSYQSYYSDLHTRFDPKKSSNRHLL